MRPFIGIFSALVVRHALAHKVRVLLTAASVAVGVAVVVAVAIANESAIASFAGSAAYVSNGAQIEVETDGAGFADAVVGRIGAVPGVAAVSPLVAGSATDPASNDAFDFVGIDLLSAAGLDGGSAPPSLSNHAARVNARIFERGAIIVSASLARRLRTRLGARVDLLVGVRSQPFFVAGIVDDDEMPLGARGTIFCDLSTAQEALDRIGRIDRIDVTLASGANNSRVRERLAEALPRGARIAAPSDRSASIEKMTEAFRFNLEALAAIALLVAAYLVFNAVSMSVVQRRAEIGIARAVGATRGVIFAVFLVEGALVGVAGSAIGMLLGRALAGAALHVVAGTIDALYAGTNPLGLTASPEAYALAGAIGIGTALAASMLPAREAASVDPATASRPGSWERLPSAHLSGFVLSAAAALAVALILAFLPPVGGRPWFGYLAALAVLAGCSLLAPALVAVTANILRLALPASAGAALRLAPANIRGRARRNAVAVASLMIGVAMTVSVSTMIESFRESVQSWISSTLKGDLFVRPTAAVNADDVVMPDGMASTLRRVDGVAAVDVIRAKQIDVAGRPAFIGASDIRVTSKFGNLPMLGGAEWRDIAPRLIGTSAAVVSEPFARKFGIARGDNVTLLGSRGPVTLRVHGVYEDYSSDAGYVFVDIGTYRRIYGDDGINGIAVYAQHGADTYALRARVERALSGARVTVQTNAQLRAEALAQFDRTFAVTSALDGIAVAVALMGIVATLAALVLERRREIGVLRCLGMARSQLRAMIVAEASLLGIMGGGLGIGAGYALAAILVFVINPQAFGWTIGFRATPGYDVALLVGVVLTAALAGLVPAESAAQLVIADAVRAE